MHNMNQIDLQYQFAVVTDGAQAIGLAIAERLLASRSVVCLWGRDEPLVRETAAMNVTDLNSAKDAAR